MLSAIEHTETVLVRLLGDPATCPHGSPIPGHALGNDTVPLSSLAAGEVGHVAPVTERLEVQRVGGRDHRSARRPRSHQPGAHPWRSLI